MLKSLVIKFPPESFTPAVKLYTVSLPISVSGIVPEIIPELAFNVQFGGRLPLSIV